MKKSIIKKISLLSFVSMIFVGCSSTNTTYLTSDDKGTATIRIYKDNSSTSKERYIAPSRVNMMHSYESLSGILANNESVCPSIGDVNLLVIPVHLPGDNTYKTDQVRNDIKEMMFGENSSRNGFVSLKEYYKESSFGKLNFFGVVTDWFDVEEHTSIKTIKDITQGNDGTIVNEILRKAVNWASNTQNIDLKDFDKNKDGSIDGVWLIYDHLDWTTEVEIKVQENPSYDGSDINQAFWNFTYWDYETLPDTNNPTTSGFSWASFDMMYTSYGDRNDLGVIDLTSLTNIKLDSHTFIHETGHLLGLDDYYATDDSYYHPAGSSTMMDQNICDLDSYSKMILGWVTPYVVYGTSEILLPKANFSENSVIVIPSNYQEISDMVEASINKGTIKDFKYDFNPFSEYLMIDLYTPDGLNKQDTYGTRIYNREAGIDVSGVRIYHVDSRIFKCRVVDYLGGQKFSYVDGYVWDNKAFDYDEAVLMPISNDKTEAITFQLPDHFDYFDRIRLLEASKINTFDQGYYASRNTLFNTRTDDFDITTFGYQFFDSNYTYNGGQDLPFKINVKTMKGI